MSMIVYLARVSKDEAEKVKSNPVSLELFPEQDTGDVIDLDKAWHAIHFALCATAMAEGLPAGFLLSGGEVLTDTMRYLNTEQIAAIDTFLSDISSEQFVQRLDFNAMQDEGVYPDFEGEEDDIDYISHYFERLRNFLKDTVSQKKSVFMVLS